MANISSKVGPSFAFCSEQFLLHARVERGFSNQTIERYAYCLKRLSTAFGGKRPDEITQPDVLALRATMVGRSQSASWQTCMLVALKGMLSFARDRLSCNALDPADIPLPKRPRREVAYLTKDEVERFLSAITLNTYRGTSRQALRFRALVEGLLGSGMRIGEILSLNTSDIDFESREARVIGKGNKQRTVFFTARAIHWLKAYLKERDDSHVALFVNRDGKQRLDRIDIWRPFMRYRKAAGINKRVTPHLLRHTAATQLLFNGCPVGHIKEILGHERLETTCRYYLGLDRRAAKQAFDRCLVYEETAGPTGPSQTAGTAQAPSSANSSPLPSSSERSSECPGAQQAL